MRGFWQVTTAFAGGASSAIGANSSNAAYGTKGDLPEARPLVPLGVAAVRRPGIDVTIVATQLMARRALEAAERLGRNGVSAEVIDLRTIAPMDVDTVLESVAGTGRIAIVQEGPIAGGWGATLLSQLVLAGAKLLVGKPGLLHFEDLAPQRVFDLPLDQRFGKVPVGRGGDLFKYLAAGREAVAGEVARLLTVLRPAGPSAMNAAP